MQDKNKNKLLDSLRLLHGESGRAHPKKTIMRSPGGPTQKKKQKNFSSCSCTLFTCANTTDLLWAF